MKRLMAYKRESEGWREEGEGTRRGWVGKWRKGGKGRRNVMEGARGIPDEKSC